MNKITTESDPLKIVSRLWQRYKSATSSSHAGAFCLSTSDVKGRSATRFVDLKEIQEQGFVFCTSALSTKGRHIDENPHVSLSFWWEDIGHQINVQGQCAPLSRAKSERLWNTRSVAAQTVSTVSQQSAVIDDVDAFAAKMSAALSGAGNEPIPCPADWGGYLVQPTSIEILEFQDSRYHLRTRYRHEDQGWQIEHLMP